MYAQLLFFYSKISLEGKCQSELFAGHRPRFGLFDFLFPVPDLYQSQKPEIYPITGKTKGFHQRFCS